jgi:hypothetical protein
VPAAVIRSKVFPLPVEEAFKFTDAAELLRKTLPEVFAESAPVFIITRTEGDEPMSPVLETSVTVEAVSTPAAVEIEPDPLAVNLIFEIEPELAITLPWTVIEPLLPEDVIKSKIFPLPADEAFRFTLDADSLRYTLPAVLEDMLVLLV